MHRHSMPSGRFGEYPNRPLLLGMGRSFLIEAQPESASHSGGEFWDAVSASMAVGKPQPVLRRNSGTRFPKQRPLGNCVPFRGGIPGCTFRWVAESVSRFEASILDALSGTAPMGKARPISAPWPVSRAAIGRLSKKITGWNVNSNRLYIQANVESTMTARPRGRSGG